MAKKSSASAGPTKRRDIHADTVRMNATQSAELAALMRRSEADIDTSDIPEVADWTGAKTGRFYRERKKWTNR